MVLVISEILFYILLLNKNNDLDNTRIKNYL